MTTPKTRRAKRITAIAGVALVACTGGLGLSASVGSDDQPAAAAAKPTPTVTGTHWPVAPSTRSNGSTRYDGGPEEGTRGKSARNTHCIDPKSSGPGPGHC